MKFEQQKQDIVNDLMRSAST